LGNYKKFAMLCLVASVISVGFAGSFTCPLFAASRTNFRHRPKSLTCHLRTRDRKVGSIRSPSRHGELLGQARLPKTPPSTASTLIACPESGSHTSKLFEEGWRAAPMTR